jgi:hypothetical protein
MSHLAASIEKNGIDKFQLPIDVDLFVQSPPLTNEDDRLIRAFIKKSKASQRRRELYAKRKTEQSPEKQRAVSLLSI